MNKANVTITRVISNNDGVLIAIEIGDSSSKLPIIRINMSCESFAKAITGFSYQPAIIKRILTEKTLARIGKRKEVKRIGIEKPENYLSKDELKGYVVSQLLKLDALRDGWELSDDGTRSRQDGKEHMVTIVRYVYEDPDFGVEEEE